MGPGFALSGTLNSGVERARVHRGPKAPALSRKAFVCVPKDTEDPTGYGGPGKEGEHYNDRLTIPFPRP